MALMTWEEYCSSTYVFAPTSSIWLEPLCNRDCDATGGREALPSHVQRVYLIKCDDACQTLALWNQERKLESSERRHSDQCREIGGLIGCSCD